MAQNSRPGRCSNDTGHPIGSTSLKQQEGPKGNSLVLARRTLCPGPQSAIPGRQPGESPSRNPAKKRAKAALGHKVDNQIENLRIIGRERARAGAMQGGPDSKVKGLCRASRRRKTAYLKEVKVEAERARPGRMFQGAGEVSTRGQVQQQSGRQGLQESAPQRGPQEEASSPGQVLQKRAWYSDPSKGQRTKGPHTRWPQP